MLRKKSSYIDHQNILRTIGFSDYRVFGLLGRHQMDDPSINEDSAVFMSVCFLTCQYFHTAFTGKKSIFLLFCINSVGMLLTELCLYWSNLISIECGLLWSSHMDFKLFAVMQFPWGGICSVISPTHKKAWKTRRYIALISTFTEFDLQVNCSEPTKDLKIEGVIRIRIRILYYTNHGAHSWAVESIQNHT